MAVCGKCIHKNVCGFCKEMGFENVVRANDFNCKDYLPIADVEKVKHGEWLDDIKDITPLNGIIKRKALVGYRCSVCNRPEFHKEPYCNCGAKMKEGTDV